MVHLFPETHKLSTIVLTNIIGTFICLFSFWACAQKNDRADTPISACNLADHVPSNIKLIELSFAKISEKNADSCVLRLIDSIVVQSTRTRDSIYLKCLSNIRAQSDGYISEYFSYVGKVLFYEDFVDLMKFLYSEHLSGDSALEQSIVESISLELSDVTDSENPLKPIQSFVNDKKSRHSFSSDEQKFIDLLVSKFDPKLMD